MELYEVAKQVDVLVVFALIYGIGLGGLMYCIMEMAGLPCRLLCYKDGDENGKDQYALNGLGNLQQCGSE